jgi:hypothetical protein
MYKPMTASTARPETQPIKVDLAEAVNSFVELVDLLEDYAPMWYSEEAHDRAQSALILLRASLGVEPPAKTSSKKHRALEYSVRNG